MEGVKKTRKSQLTLKIYLEVDKSSVHRISGIRGYLADVSRKSNIVFVWSRKIDGCQGVSLSDSADQNDRGHARKSVHLKNDQDNK